MNKREFAKTQARILACVTHYEVLGVSAKATAEVIKTAHRVLASALHPDRCVHDGSASLMATVNVAYTTLSDKDSRRRYDMVVSVADNPCPKCQGTGIVKKQRGFAPAVRQSCPACGGTGLCRE